MKIIGCQLEWLLIPTSFKRRRVVWSIKLGSVWTESRVFEMEETIKHETARWLFQGDKSCEATIVIRHHFVTVLNCVKLGFYRLKGCASADSWKSAFPHPVEGSHIICVRHSIALPRFIVMYCSRIVQLWNGSRVKRFMRRFIRLIY